MSDQRTTILIVGAVVGAAIGSVIYKAAKRRREEELREKQREHATAVDAVLQSQTLSLVADVATWRKDVNEQFAHCGRIR